jgi:hypothetical protein
MLKIETDYRAQIAGAVRATVFPSPTCFRWFNSKPFQLPRWMLDSFHRSETRNMLLMNLQWQLYQDFYCSGSATPSVDSNQPASEVDSILFVAKLDAANSGRGFSESRGWSVRKLRDGKMIARRDGLELAVRPEDFLRRADSRHPATTTALRVPQGLLNVSPGFYMAAGDTDLSTNSRTRISRFYWNLRASGAVRFIREVTSTFNAARVPFRVKVANHPNRFNRCDAGVLYLHIDDYQHIGRLLGKILRGVATHLQPATPALTKALAPGLGWAEDPGTGDSFGLHRCYLIADGMLRACESRKHSMKARLRAVEARFEEERVSLNEPYRNQMSRPSATPSIHLT